jgi:hypothetical protein
MLSSVFCPEHLLQSGFDVDYLISSKELSQKSAFASQLLRSVARYGPLVEEDRSIIDEDRATRR